MLSIVAVVIDNLEINKRFISSIRQYTDGDYELIIIDNESHDNLAIEHTKSTADIYYRFDKRTDLAKAWNRGIDVAKGEYIAVVNNDVVVPPKWSESLIEVLDTHKNAGMVCPMTLTVIKDLYFKYELLEDFDKSFQNPFKLIKFKDIVYGEFCVFKKEALDNIGGYCELYKYAHAEDLEICFQLFQKGWDIYIDPRVFVYHQGCATHNPDIVDMVTINKADIDNFELFKSRWPKYTKSWL
jgi:GT2 family glycosyltransferase